ncbi:MAG: GNAT family N-acetyltransferase [Lentisphaeraceae bacterium]|nr:GNAT family N-acetyltransferase [Lentisphaeraceae bacterium]
MDIRKITWQEALPVRHKVLWPDKNPEFCMVEGDNEAKHFGVFTEEKLVCVASLYIDGSSIRLRKFATLKEFQGNGFGTAMLKFLINEAKPMGMEHFWFDARETALNFYRRFGFKANKQRFLKSGIPYYKMSSKIK